MRNAGPTSISRRGFLRIAGTLAITPLFLTTRSAKAGMWSHLFSSPKRTISPIITNEEFYITSYRTPPFVPAEQWALSIRGTVKSPFTMQGFAFAGSRDIHQVDISTDGGESWASAILAPPQSQHSWVMWSYSWEPQRPGDHRILARATDGTGKLQSAREHPPFPDGASGLHEVIVSVV